MKVLIVEAMWRTTHEVEVPDYYEWDGLSLDDEWADQIDASTASLADWDVKEGK